MNLTDLKDFEVEEDPNKPKQLNLADLGEVEVEPIPEKSKSTDPYAAMDTENRGFFDMISLSTADNVTGAAEAIWDKVKGNPEEFIKLYRQHQQESEANYKKAEEADPSSYMKGQIKAAVIPALASGGFAVPAMTAAMAKTAAKKAAVGGVIQGLGATKADMTSGKPEEIVQGVKDAAASGAISLATGGVGKMIPEAASRVGQFAHKTGESFKNVAEYLSAKAMGLTKSSMKNMGADKIKQVGRFGLDQIDEVTGKPIVTPLASTKTMLKRADNINTKAGKGMEEVYDTIDEYQASTFDPQAVADKFDNEHGDFYRSAINRPEAQTYDNVMETLRMRGAKNLPMKEAQIMKKELDRAANWNKPAHLEITPREKMAREASTMVKNSIEESADWAASSPALSGEFKQTLKNAKNQYGASVNAKKLLTEKQAQQGNKLFSLTDAVTTGPMGTVAAVTQDPKMMLATAATYVTKKGAEMYGPQIAAVGADKLGNLLKKSPEMFGKWGPILNQAAQQGEKKLAITNYVMQQNNQEYREQMKNIFSGEDDE